MPAYKRSNPAKLRKDLEAIDADITSRVPIDSEDPEYKAKRIARSPQPRRRGATVGSRPRRPANTA